MKRSIKRKSRRHAAQLRTKTAPRKASKPKSAPAKAAPAKQPLAKTSRDKVRAHRARLRAQGMRPVTMWVPDMRSPKFAAEARRQCLLANNSPYAAEDQAWVDSMSDWKAD